MDLSEYDLRSCNTLCHPQIKYIQSPYDKIALIDKYNSSYMPCVQHRANYLFAFYNSSYILFVFSSLFVIMPKKISTYQLSRENATLLYSQPGVGCQFTFTVGLHLWRLNLLRDLIYQGSTYWGIALIKVPLIEGFDLSRLHSYRDDNGQHFKTMMTFFTHTCKAWVSK